MNVRPSACLFALFLLAGCPEKKETTEESSETSKPEDKKTATTNTATTTGAGPATTTATTPPTTTTPPPTTTTPSTAPTGATTETAPRPAGIEPRAKAEIDGKPDGITGVPQPLTAARAMVQTPKEWTATKGDTIVAKSADDKARVAMTSFGPEGPTPKAEAAATAAGLTACTWAPPEAVKAGKDKLDAQVSDGLCTRGTAQVKAAMMAVDGLVVVGSWDEGGDMATVFGVMRSVVRNAAVNPLAACCNALRQNAKSAPPQQMGAYMMAAAACDAAKGNPQAIASIRSALGGAGMPSTCR